MKEQAAILLVEDTDSDAELTAMAFEEAEIGNPVVRVRDGVEALDYLFGRGRYSGRDCKEVPAVVLLDLNLPRLNGIEVLKTIRADDALKRLLVVVLTSSAEDKDRLAAYEHYANSYIQKPVDFDRFVEYSRRLGHYWLMMNVPPPQLAAG